MNKIEDYFVEFKLPIDGDGIRKDIAELINSDINNYREHMISQYNGDIRKATDEFCFKKFLNDYSIVINVFGLHKDYNCRGSFNKFISSCWQTIKEDFCQ